VAPIRRTLTFRIDNELHAGLQEVWERDGVAVSEQIRRAIRDWLGSKGVTVKTELRRADTRKRSL